MGVVFLFLNIFETALNYMLLYTLIHVAVLESVLCDMERSARHHMWIYGPEADNIHLDNMPLQTGLF